MLLLHPGPNLRSNKVTVCDWNRFHHSEEGESGPDGPLIGPRRSQDARNYKPLITEVAQPIGPDPGKVRSGCLYKNGLGTAPYNDTGLGPTDSTLLRPQIKALNTVVKQHKVDALLDVSQCMHDPKGETLCLPLDGKTSMKEVLQDGFVGIEKSDDWLIRVVTVVLSSSERQKSSLSSPEFPATDPSSPSLKVIPCI
ncbi:hypothetical protein MJT46_004025 [Ovis ammon polii x Ovis aries]|nr:hypothetical protein MJT46_004025 [Ovis ammon polii x Ovis aries]